jgi:hypothetical protein
MASSSWQLFPYNDDKLAMAPHDSAVTTPVTSAVKTPKISSSQFYIWSREVLPTLNAIASGADLWYTVMLRFRQSADNKVSRSTLK